jgi:hypothetical protein
MDSFKIGHKNSWEDLSYEDQEAIEDGLNQLNEGNSISYSEVRKEIESILNPLKIL